MRWEGKSGIDGQKSVCMDKGVIPVPKACIVYSFGINNEWSFDTMFEKFGCQIYAFDPSMNMGDRDYTTNIHFYRIGISDVDTDREATTNWKLRTLDSIYKMLEPRHGKDVIIGYYYFITLSFVFIHSKFITIN